MLKVREPIVAGIFYPDSEILLQEELQRLQRESSPPAILATKAVITPHAAYEYTGRVTTAAYLSLAGSRGEAARHARPGRILLIGPLHRERENKFIFPEAEVFRSPLGDVRIERESVEKLTASCSCAEENEIPYAEEHCLETQIPFIHYYFPEAAVLPVLAGAVTKRNVSAFVDALFSVIPDLLETTSVVATVNSATAENYDTAINQARELEEQLIPGNQDYFFSGEASKHLSSCSPQCIGLLLDRQFRCSKTELIDQVSSADIYNTGGKTVVYSAYSLC